MNKNIIILISVIVLSLSITFSSIYVGNAILKVNETNAANSTQMTTGLLMNSDEAAKYLGIPVETLIAKIKKERIEKAKLNVYNTYQFIPYLEINEVIYFTKSELLKWAEYQTNTR